MQFVLTLTNHIINKSEINEVSIIDYNEKYSVVASFCNYNCSDQLFIGSKEECIVFVRKLEEDLNK